MFNSSFKNLFPYLHHSGNGKLTPKWRSDINKCDLSHAGCSNCGTTNILKLKTKKQFCFVIVVAWKENPLWLHFISQNNCKFEAVLMYITHQLLWWMSWKPSWRVFREALKQIVTDRTTFESDTNAMVYIYSKVIECGIYNVFKLVLILNQKQSLNYITKIYHIYFNTLQSYNSNKSFGKTNRLTASI